MGIQFNGNVTINGNVEVYENGSMRITNNNPVNIHVDELINLVEQKISDPNKKEEYMEALKELKTSTDDSKIIKAYNTIKELGKDLGMALLVQGLSPKVYEIVKSLFS